MPRVSGDLLDTGDTLYLSSESTPGVVRKVTVAQVPHGAHSVGGLRITASTAIDSAWSAAFPTTPSIAHRARWNSCHPNPGRCVAPASGNECSAASICAWRSGAHRRRTHPRCRRHRHRLLQMLDLSIGGARLATKGVAAAELRRDAAIRSVSRCAMPATSNCAPASSDRIRPQRPARRAPRRSAFSASTSTPRRRSRAGCNRSRCGAGDRSRHCAVRDRSEQQAIDAGGSGDTPRRIHALSNRTVKRFSKRPIVKSHGHECRAERRGHCGRARDDPRRRHRTTGYAARHARCDDARSAALLCRGLRVRQAGRHRQRTRSRARTRPRPHAHRPADALCERGDVVTRVLVAARSEPRRKPSRSRPSAASGACRSSMSMAHSPVCSRRATCCARTWTRSNPTADHSRRRWQPARRAWSTRIAGSKRSA